VQIGRLIDSLLDIFFLDLKKLNIITYYYTYSKNLDLNMMNIGNYTNGELSSFTRVEDPIDLTCYETLGDFVDSSQPPEFEDNSLLPLHSLEDCWLFDVLTRDMYNVFDPLTCESLPKLVEKKKTPEISPQESLSEQHAYAKFQHKFRNYSDTVSESGLRTVYEIFLGTYTMVQKMVNSDIAAEKQRQLAQETMRAAAKARVVDYKTASKSDDYILLKNRYWRKFNGFTRLTNTKYPIGPFAPRCNRCSTFGVFRNLIPCHVLTKMDSEGNSFQCMSELCISCYWLYHKERLANTSALRLTSKFLDDVFSADNISNFQENYKHLYSDVIRNGMPENNVYVKAMGEDVYYGLFGAKQYPYYPPRSVRDRSILPQYEKCKIYELGDIIQEQEVATRERHHAEERACRLKLQYYGRRKRKISGEFDSDLHTSLTHNDNRVRAEVRKRAVGSEFIENSLGQLVRRSTREATINYVINLEEETGDKVVKRKYKKRKRSISQVPTFP